MAGKAALIVGDKDDAWRRALLRYNGCVGGTTTPACSGYPESVRRQVEQAGKVDVPRREFRSVRRPTDVACPRRISYEAISVTPTPPPD